MEERTTIATLVRRARQGDQDAWAELYQATVKNAYFTARKVLGNQDEAVDLVQEAYITAFERLEQLEDEETFPAWLSMIVANKCKDWLKRKKPALFSELRTEDGPEWDWEDFKAEGQPAQVLDQKETVRLVAQMIDRLPEDQKLCVILYYKEELTVSQIAQTLEVSEGTVKSRLNYARRKIKEQAEELEKRGTKLHGISPLPLLGLLAEEETARLPETLAAEKVTAGTSAASAAATPQAAGLLGGLSVKLMAGAAAVAVAGGAVVHTFLPEKKAAEDKEPQTAQEETLDIYEAAEIFLSSEITPHGVETNYYAYLDLEKDGVPELLISNRGGTEEDMSSAELYHYDGTAFSLCGKTGAWYVPFYVVNETQLMGQSRMGKEYTGVGERLVTAAYHWNEEMTCNDPAIQRNGGDWEYITEEEFDYYNLLPEQSESEPYIRTMERVLLERNPFRQESSEERAEVIVTPYYRIPVPARWEGKYVVETQYEEETAITWVYEKTCYDTAEVEGLLFWVTMYPAEEDISYLPSYQAAGECKVGDAIYQVVVGLPTDVQFLPEQMEAYLSLTEDMPWICENVTAINEYVG